MECVFVRHGEASLRANSDRERCLTSAGLSQVTVAATWLNANWQPEYILVSPFVRAQQSAEAFLSFYPQAKAQNSEALTPDVSLGELQEAIARTAVDRLLLIGHNPLFSNALSWFCGDELREVMAPASMALVDLPVAARGVGRLRWLRHAPNYQAIASCQ